MVGNPFKSKLPLYDARKKADLAHEYRNSAELQTKGLTSTDQFKTYVGERKTKLSAFDKLKTPSGEEVADKLKAAANAALINDEFAKAMKLDQPTIDARKEFDADIAAPNSVVQAKPPIYNMSSIAHYLNDTRASIEKTITKQHEEETKRVEALFSDNTFKGNLQTQLGIGAGDLDTFKNDTLAALKTSQDEELAKIDAAIKKEALSFHDNARKENERIAYLAIMYHNSANMRKAIDARAEKLGHPGEAKQTSISNTYNPNGLGTFKGIKVSDLEMIESITGKTIKNNGNGNFTIDFSRSNNISHSLLGSMGDIGEASLSDLTSMAEAVRACGYNQITTNIDMDFDQDRAMELGRQAYEAAVRAGFYHGTVKKGDKDQNAERFIKIMVNNQLMHPDQLFEGQDKRRQAIEAMYKSNRTANTNQASMHKNTTDISALKGAIKAERAKGAAATAPAPAAGGGPVP